MSVVASVGERLRVTELAPIIREYERALKDRSYRRHPVGQDVGRFLRALRWSDAAANTLDTYELVLARLAIDHADYDSLDQFCSPVGTDYLRRFLDRHWGDASAATRANRLAIVRSFFKWAVEEGRCAWNPAQPIKGPKSRNRERATYKRETVARLLAAQDSLRDECALLLLCRLALRKAELAAVRIRDVDLTRDLILVHGKGGREALLPLGYRDLRDRLYLHIQGDDRQPAEYLLYPRERRTQPMELSTVHRWFKRCLAAAELPETIQMHELRHFAGDEMWRETGDLVKAQRLLRHASVATTQIYLHPSQADLEAGMATVAKAWERSDS